MGNPKGVRNPGLETRALKALRQLGICTIDDLLRLDASKVGSIRGCGEGVCQHLLSVQNWLKSKKVSEMPEPEMASFIFNLLLSNLTRLARRSLKKLEVDDLYGLTAVRYFNALRIRRPYLYPETWDEISFIRRQAVKALGGIALGRDRKTIRDPKTIVLEAPIEESVFALPLFSNLEPDFFPISKFHQAWHAEWTVSNIALPYRARLLCKDFRIESFGQLLLLQGREFIVIKGGGESTLKNVHDVVRFVLLGGLAEMQKKIDYSCFKTMVDSWISMAIPVKTTGDTFTRGIQRRFEFLNGKLRTYESIAQELGISSSRIGQIWKAGRSKLMLRQNLVILEPFWTVVNQELKREPSHLDELAESIAKAFHWSVAPSGIVLGELLSLNPEIELEKREYLTGPKRR